MRTACTVSPPPGLEAFCRSAPFPELPCETQLTPPSTGRVADSDASTGRGCGSSATAAATTEASSSIFEFVKREAGFDVDDYVMEKLDRVWQKGFKAMSHIEREGKESMEDLASKINEFQERQRSLEAENVELKNLVNGLMQQLSYLGYMCPDENGCFGMAGVACSPSTGTGTPSSIHQALAGGSVPQSSPSGSVSDGEAMSVTGLELPHIPSFPFLVPPCVTPAPLPVPSTPPAAPAPARTPLAIASQLPPAPAPTTALGGVSPFSLADALGFGEINTEEDTVKEPAVIKSIKTSTLNPNAAPWSLSESIGLSPPTSKGAAPLLELDANDVIFTIILQVAGGTELGLITSIATDGSASRLRVDGVLPHGAVDAWNRQCITSGAPDQALQPGDKIASVNDVCGDGTDMLIELGRQHLIHFRLKVIRSNRLA